MNRELRAAIAAYRKQVPIAHSLATPAERDVAGQVLILALEEIVGRDGEMPEPQPLMTVEREDGSRRIVREVVTEAAGIVPVPWVVFFGSDNAFDWTPAFIREIREAGRVIWRRDV